MTNGLVRERWNKNRNGNSSGPESHAARWDQMRGKQVPTVRSESQTTSENVLLKI